MLSNPYKSKTSSEGLSNIYSNQTSNPTLFRYPHPTFHAQSLNFQSSSQDSSQTFKRSHTSPPLSKTLCGKVLSTIPIAFIPMSPFSNTTGIHPRKFNRRMTWLSTTNLQDCPVTWSLAQKANSNVKSSKRLKPKRFLPKKNPSFFIPSPTYCH